MDETQMHLLQDEIPEELYSSSEKCLRLPKVLSDNYEKELLVHGVTVENRSKSDRDGPIGGVDEKATYEHFVRAFNGSCARVQLAILNPNFKDSIISDAFIGTFSGGRVAFVDLPCGCGASFLSVVTTIACLREKGVLPREPLDIALTAGDISEHARKKAEKLLAAIMPSLEKQGIFISSNFLEWDATKELSTVDLIKSMTNSANGCKRIFLLIANFSGFLSANGKQKASMEQLRQVFLHASGAGSSGVWIESRTNQASTVIDWVNKSIVIPIMKLFNRGNADQEFSYNQIEDESKVADCIEKNSIFKVRLMASSMNLSRNNGA